MACPTYNEFLAPFFEYQQDNGEHANAMCEFESQKPMYNPYSNIYNAKWWDHQ